VAVKWLVARWKGTAMWGRGGSCDKSFVCAGKGDAWAEHGESGRIFCWGQTDWYRKRLNLIRDSPALLSVCEMVIASAPPLL